MGGEPEARTVWILGAGFSRPLDAPIFKDPFRSNHRVQAACGGKAPQPLLDTIAYYRAHAPSAVGGEGDEQGVFWRDPEEFLDVIESALRGATPKEELMMTDRPPMSLRDMTEAARKALALECSHFLRGANLATERWSPYLNWATSHGLAGGDTVLTFNYDRVPDLLETHSPMRATCLLEVIAPSSDPEDDLQDCRDDNSVPVLKLHGSVDWVLEDGVLKKADWVEDLPLKKSLFLGVPGPSKADMGRGFAFVKALWTASKMELQRAARVIFIGYRFPPTDADARRLFLEALGEGFRSSTLKRVDVVLGPDTNHPDAARMRGLLGSVVRPARVHVHPLYAEDFLSFPRGAV